MFPANERLQLVSGRGSAEDPNSSGRQVPEPACQELATIAHFSSPVLRCPQSWLLSLLP